MTNNTQKEVQKKPLIGRIEPSEIFLMLVGIGILTYGLINEMTMIIFWGCVIVPGVIILHQVRKTDWTKHWQDMEADQKAAIAQAAQRRSAAEEARKGANGGK